MKNTKQNPDAASVSGFRETDQASKRVNREGTSPTAWPQVAAIPSTAVSLYDGRHHLGWTVERGERFEAITPARLSLGLFNNAGAARNALSTTSRGAT